MNADDSIGTRLGQIMDESVRLARSASATVLTYVVSLTAVGTAIDQMPDLSTGSSGEAAVSVVVGYYLTVQLMQGGGLVSSGARGGIFTYLGLSLLSGLGIGLGILALAIPGLILFVRWAPAYGYVLGGGARVSDGLGMAWAQTRAHFWPLALALMVPVAVNVGAVLVYVLASDDLGMISLPASLLINFGIACAGLAITAVGLAAYALLRDQRDELAEIFG